MVLGGIFVSLYCLYEYVGGTGEVALRDNLVITLAAGIIVGPFGASYFQLAQTSSLLFACSLMYSVSPFSGLRKSLDTLIAAAISSFIAWPVFVSGARTGLALVLFSAVILAIINREVRRIILVSVFLISPVLLLLSNVEKVLEFVESGTTVQRLIDLEEDDEEDSIAQRLGISIDISKYMAGPWLPVIGAGFYVSPVSGSGNVYAPISFNGETYDGRIDFGIHSVYLFPFEQAGVVGLFFFLWFVIEVLKCLRKATQQKNSTDTVPQDQDTAGIAQTMQERVERTLNSWLDARSPLWQTRPAIRGEVFVDLYRLRNTLFGIKATSKRKMIPGRYRDNWAALTAILEAAKRSGICIVLYVAPIRDDAEIPYDAAEYVRFKLDLENLARQYEAVFKNLESLVPAEFWGSKSSTGLGDGPELDFMHFQAGGHKIVAPIMEHLVVEALANQANRR